MINLLLAESVPILVFGTVAAWMIRKRRSRNERPPVASKLLRPAGHSLAVRQETLSAQLQEYLALSLVACVFCGALLEYAPAPSPLVIAVLVLMTGAVAAFCVVQGLRIATRLRRVRLGRLGEQMVGEELEPLREDGYRIFHDFPGGPKWNIDHIAIGSGGVFVFETKTRSKRRAESKQPEHEVLFEEDTLRFPWGNDCKAASQARYCAASLGRFLRGSTAEPVEVGPVLVLPGWYVTTKGRSDVRAVSAKGLAKVIRKFPPILSAGQIQRLAFQVEQKCRDVEF